jgi:hypothetical protein
MTKTEKLDKLLSDINYYGDFGKQFLSNSDIDSLINDPASFHQPKEEIFEFKFGKAFHELIMFGETEHTDIVINASNRNTNIYKDKYAEVGSHLFLTKEYDQLMYIVDKVHANAEVSELVLGKDLKYEVPAIGNLFSEEVEWKGKADILHPDLIVDLKTTSNLKLFAKSVRTYNYDSQAYIYSTLFDRPIKFVAIDKTTGIAGIFDVSEFTQLDGQGKAEIAEENYIKYFLRESEEVQNHTIYGKV